MKLVRALSLIACALELTSGVSAARAAAARDWSTPAERAGYRTTPSYEETIAYCRRLAAASPWVRYTTYGTSSQGRALPLVILSRDRAFTPEAARRAGKPIVLVQNGIHSGEIEGKDACLALMRDIAVQKTHAALLDHATLLVLPIFSVDAHERRSRYNRINQNGPEEMGWRSTALGLNLNRDYLKAETPEMRALIGNVFTRWWPHLLVDDHTTDGADYQHDVTYGFNHGPVVPGPVERWLTDAFEGRVMPRLAAMGHLPAPYLTFRDGNDPRSGIDFGSQTPRFSTGYAPLQGRPGILVETHMLKPYADRIRATYDLLVALLEEVNARPRALLQAVSESEAEIAARARAADPAARRVALTGRTTDTSVPFPYRGKVTTWEWSDVAAARVPRYRDTPWDTVVPLFRDVAPGVVVTAPAGYLVPQEWTAARRLLELHGVRVQRLTRAFTDSVEVARIDEWSAPPRAAEGHRPTSAARVTLVTQRRTYRPGDLWVPLDQPRALVAMHILEAQAPDGLLYWNAFDTVLEKKEYAEDYVMEPLAREMLAKDPVLAREFQTRVASDTSFARNSGERLDFFYRRSLWADPEQDLHPAARARRPVPIAYLTRGRVTRR